MRDAFGGTFMIQIFIVFILIYISFTALALNYAKAFKAKNFIVDYLEENEIMNLNETAELYDEMVRTFEKEIFVGLNYKTNKSICDKPNSETYYCDQIGFKIERVNKPTDSNTGGIYYTVSTYVGWDMGFLSPLLSLNGNNKDPDHVPGYWKISGQTRLIYRDN